MRRLILLSLAAAMLAAGCASTFEFRREEVFQDTVRSYGRLMTWSDFGAAAAFLDPDAPLKSVPSGVRIAGYDYKQAVFAQDMLEAVNLIEITYYKEQDPRVKKIMDRQVWVFNSDKQNWFLKSGFPPF